MKNVLKVFGIIVFAAIMGFSFASCATDSGGGGGTPEELAAADLAAELNGILEGCAVVNGTTVKLTGSYFFGDTLTVPEGVTLDITDEGTEDGFQDNAGLGLGNRMGPVTLTVNGTIITRYNHLRFEDGQSEATINGSGTIRYEGEEGFLNIGDNRNLWDVGQKLTIDGVTLLGGDNDWTLVRVGKAGELVMKSGAIKDNPGYGVFVEEGGILTRNDDPHEVGGGIFTMEGGTISGNGGGVYIEPDTEGMGSGTFTMNSPALAGVSGNISGNTRDGGAHNVYNDGGTVNGSANPNPENITNGLVW